MFEELFINFSPELTVISQVKNYLDRSSSEKNLEYLLDSKTRVIQKSLSKIPVELQSIQNKSIEIVCSNLDSGVNRIMSDLDAVRGDINKLSSEINQMSAIMTWGFSKLIRLQSITNSLLQDLRVLLKIPDIQKERHYHIENGLKYLKTAILSGDSESEFYEFSIQAFSKAIDIEPHDYFSHFYIGFIYLNSKNHIDPKQAIFHFDKSGKFALSEDNVGGGSTSTNLTSSFFSNNSIKLSPYKIIATESFFYIARSFYLLKNFSKAVEFSDAALSIFPEFHIATYEKAKYLLLNGFDKSAFELLEKLIKQDPYYAIKIANDQNYLRHKNIISFLSKLREDEKRKNDTYVTNVQRLMIRNPISKVASKLNEWTSREGDDYLELRLKNDNFKRNHLWSPYDFKQFPTHPGMDWKWMIDFSDNSFTSSTELREMSLKRTIPILEFAKKEKELFEVVLPNAVLIAEENNRRREQERKEENVRKLRNKFITWTIIILLFIWLVWASN